MHPVRRQISAHAGRLRRDATDVEQRLWSVLRNRQLDGRKFRRQATLGRYIVDFLCVEARLVVELDGGSIVASGMRRERRGWRETVIGYCASGTTRWLKISTASCRLSQQR